VKVSAVCMAAICLILSLVFAPWLVKLAIVSVPLFTQISPFNHST
jgi:hypothetical protein